MEMTGSVFRVIRPRISCVLLPTLLSITLDSSCVGQDSTPKTRCALVVGIDGLRPDQLGSGRTPCIDDLVSRGTSSVVALNAWSPEQPWNGHSATNWGVLLTGVSPERSEVTANNDRDHRIGRDNPTPDRVETVFGYVRDARPNVRTAVANTWSGILREEWTLLGRDRSVIDWTHHPGGDESSSERDRQTVDAVCARLAETGRTGTPWRFGVRSSQPGGCGRSHSYLRGTGVRGCRRASGCPARGDPQRDRAAAPAGT